MNSVNTLDVGKEQAAVVDKHVQAGQRKRSRPARQPGPLPMQGEIAPDAPPEAPEAKSLPLMKIIMPIVMIVAVVGMVAMMFVSGMARNPMTFIFPMMMVASMLGMVTGSGAKGADIGPARRDYQRHLASIRRAIVKASRDQRLAATYIHPAPVDLWQMTGRERAFERGLDDDDYLVIRVGIGAQRPATPVTPPEIPAPEKLDPVSAVALRHVIRQARVVSELPVSIDLKAFPMVAIAGDDSSQSQTEVAGLARAIVAQCATFHHPDDVVIASVSAGKAWDWVKWLPHNWDASREDSAGLWRLNGRCISEVIENIASMTPQPISVVIVVDTEDALSDEDIQSLSTLVSQAERNRERLRTNPEITADELGICHVIVLAPHVRPDHVFYHAAVSLGLSFFVRDGSVFAETSGGSEDIATADYLGPASAEALARGLAQRGKPKLQLSGNDSDTETVLHELSLVPPVKKREFRQRVGKERLRIPVGTKENGEKIYLDFKESAEGGVGPHGLCVGATGSGKSEFLKSTVLGLAATHSPEQLNFVLVDFKGGATFLGLDSLPHVSAVITNLADELILVDRMQDAIRGEMTRRQEVLRAAGNFAGVSEYEQARMQGRDDLAPLPALLIVVDEFSELLAARPEFSDLFVAVGRLGRSLHMHLLLASQRLEEGRLRGLESHLSYRIGLKTFSPAESRSVLGVPDAYHLPSIPGSGYLKTDSHDPVRFRAAYVSGAVPDDHVDEVDDEQVLSRETVVSFSARSISRREARKDALVHAARSARTPAQTHRKWNSTTVLESAVDSMRHMPRRAHRVWLPPLPPRISRQELGSVDNNKNAPSEPLRQAQRELCACIGIVDKPLIQRQEKLVVDLGSTGGHVAIVGAPRSGKTTAIRTLILGLAENSAASKLHVYVVDYGAGGLADLQKLPHVSAVSHRGEEEKIRRVIGFLHAEISRREEWFRQSGWHTADSARRAGASDIVLCIDGWPAFRNEHAALSEKVQSLVSDGLAVGIHVVLSAHRWTELRPAIRDLLGTRIELRQAEAIDSVIDRKAAASVPESPGRGLSMDGFAFLLADSSPQDTADAAQRFRQRGDEGENEAPKLKLLPRKISYTQLQQQLQQNHGLRIERSRIAVGLEESGLTPMYFDSKRERHLLIFGAAEAGRTSALATLIAGMASTLEKTKYVVIDYRRGLLEAVPPTLLAGYAGSAAVAEPLVKELAATLASRLPKSDITPAQLKARDWWEGPDIVLVIDDYDLVCGGRKNPLLPLSELIPHCADIGLKIVIARRISGAHRSLHDQVLGAVKDQGATAFLMSGAKEDGPLFGVPITAQPPGRGNWVRHGQPPQVVQVSLPPVSLPPASLPPEATTMSEGG